MTTETELIRPKATPEQLAAAKKEWDCVEELSIDSDAFVSEAEDGAFWIQAWVYMAAPEVGNGD